MDGRYELCHFRLNKMVKSLAQTNMYIYTRTCCVEEMKKVFL